jgi:hypothetical protein
MRSWSVCGRFWSNERLEPALLVEDAGEAGDAMVDAYDMIDGRCEVSV